MIIDNMNNLHYLAVKNISRFLGGITSNRNGDFYCLKYFDSYKTKEKLKKHKRICKNHDFCYVKMLDKSLKMPDTKRY